MSRSTRAISSPGLSGRYSAAPAIAAMTTETAKPRNNSSASAPAAIIRGGPLLFHAAPDRLRNFVHRRHRHRHAAGLAGGEFEALSGFRPELLAIVPGASIIDADQDDGGGGELSDDIAKAQIVGSAGNGARPGSMPKSIP